LKRGFNRLSNLWFKQQARKGLTAMAKLAEKKRKLELYRSRLVSVKMKGLKKSSIAALKWYVSYRNQTQKF
jgi:hypothetical protein